MQDRYEIRGEIGEGGVGVVYEAWDRQLARVVAIKRLLPLEGKQAEERARNQSTAHDLLREASILSSVQHPNIVSVFDAGVDEFGAYVVMERIEGEMLRDAIQRGPLLLRDFTQVVEQTLDALITAHHHGLLHRDIKPRNFMFRWLPSDLFQVKILDFGLAKFSPKPSLQTEAYKDTIMGSSAYMAPEQFEHRPLDFRSDLYSLGCVYYYCLTAELPFDGETPSEVMEAHLEHKVASLVEKRPDLPPALTEWVMGLIERQPDDRPPSAKEALNGFLKALAGSSGEPRAVANSLAESAPAPPRSLSHGHLKGIGLATAAVLLATIGFLAWPKQGRRENPPSNAAAPAIQLPADPFGKAPYPAIQVQDTARMEELLGQDVSVRGQVTNVGKDSKGINYLNFLNRAFYAVCFSPGATYFPEGEPAQIYAQKTIQISGRLEKYNDRFQIKLYSPKQVQVAK